MSYLASLVVTVAGQRWIFTNFRSLRNILRAYNSNNLMNSIFKDFGSTSDYNSVMTGINNREHPRFSFSPGAWVKIVRKDAAANDSKMYQLIDISQSGISFKVHSISEWKRGDHFFIVQVGEKVLNEALLGQVRYVQPLDLLEVDFKVGGEFIERL